MVELDNYISQTMAVNASLGKLRQSIKELDTIQRTKV